MKEPQSSKGSWPYFPGGLRRAVFLFAAGAFVLQRSDARPLIEAFTTNQLQSDGAAWAFARTPDGTLVVGANKLLIQEGDKWETLEIPGAYAFRGLAASSGEGTDAGGWGRVYAGAIGDLGYIERNRTGEWKWTSLKEEFEQASHSLLDEVWHVQVSESGVVYVAKNQVARWDGRVFQVWNLPCEPRLISMDVGKDLWLYQEGTGLLRMGEKGPQILFPDSELPSTPVIWALPENSAGSFLVGTNDGVFRQRGNQWDKLEPLSSRIAHKQPINAVWTASSSKSGEKDLAIGTFLAGIVVASQDGAVKAVIDRGSGLPDNSVHQIWADPEGGLWAGFTRGFARMPALGFADILEEQDGLSSPANSVVQIGQRDFITTDHEAFEFVPGDTAGPTLTPLPPLNAFLWSSAGLDGELFVSGFGGIWGLDQKKRDWTRELTVSADVFDLAPSKMRSGWIYYTKGTSLKALESRKVAIAAQQGLDLDGSVAEGGSTWIPRDLAQKVDDTPVSLLEDNEGLLWVSTHKGGVFRYQLLAEPGTPARLVRMQKFEQGGNLPEGLGSVRLTTVGGRICFLSDHGIFALDKGHLAIGRMGELEGWIVDGASPELPDGSAYWLLRGQVMNQSALYQVKWSDDGSRLETHPLVAPGLGRIGSPAGMFATVETQGAVLWICGSTGLLRLETSQLAAPADPPKVALRSVLAQGTERLDLTAVGTRLDSKIRQMQFEFAPLIPEDSLRYETRLGPSEEGWSSAQSAEDRDYAALRSGNYVFNVRAMDPWGREGPATRYAFAIAAPWWATWPAYAGYFLAVVLGIYLLTRWRLEALRRQNERLNRLVEERTHELAMANTAKAEFLENISHEIRNPLNGVVGLVGLLREVPLDARARSLAGSLAACARTLTRVFDEVLGFSKLEYGQVPLNMRAFSPALLLEDVADVFRATATQRGSELRLKWDKKPPPALLGDDEKIRTIVANFVSNAFKYAPASSVEIVAQAETIETGYVELTVNVTDHGPGILPEDQALIFKKFVRGTEARKQDVPGTGLGLAACKALADLMGGFVGVESEPGKGATFYLRVRLKEANPADVIQADHAEAVGLPRVAEFGEKLLVVEDEDYNQIVCVRIAEKLGFAADVAPDAGIALERMAAGRYSVVLVDWELSGAKGSDVARKVRTMDGGAAPIIIAATAHDSENVRRECLDSGMDGFALKPLEAGQIAQIILEARAKRNGGEKMGDAGDEQLDARVFSLVGENRREETIAAALTWIETLERHLATLHGAIAEDKSGDAARTTHKIRAHAGLIGAHSLSKAAAALQVALDNGENGGPLLPTLLGSVETASARAKVRVRDWLERQGSNGEDSAYWI